MSNPAKFLFDIDFDAPKVANTIPLADHHAKVEEAGTNARKSEEIRAWPATHRPMVALLTRGGPPPTQRGK